MTITRASPPTIEALQIASSCLFADSKIPFLRSLSLAEMVLVIVCNKLRKHGVPRINFELLWEHVSRPQDTFGSLASFAELQDKALMLRVLEHLVEVGVFRYTPQSARSPASFRLLQLQASDAQVCQALVADSTNEDVSTLLRAWSR